MSGEGPPFSAPAAFGRFRVLHQIGAGSLGPVFRGEDPTNRTTVVIKVIQLNLPPERAHEVAEGLRGLEERLPVHPVITELVAAGLHDVSPYVVSTFAAGQSLDVALREFGPAVISDALPRLTSLAEGLDLASESWSWHGNLHPRDIVIDEDQTKIVGLGIAPIVERAGGRLPMRRPYTAPEVIDGKPTAPASDQYALAAMAYEWLFGRRAPGPAETPIAAPPLPGVDGEAISAAFTSALAADPAARFESCRAFVAALAQSVTDETLAAAPEREKPRRDRRRLASPLPLLDEAPIAMPAAGIDVPEATVEPLTHEVSDDEAISELVLSIQSELDAAGSKNAAERVEIQPPEPSESKKSEPEKTEPVAPAAQDWSVRPVEPARDVEPPPMTIEPIAPVAWQGSLGGGGEEYRRHEKRGFGFAALIGALLIGVAGGLGGSYLLWRSNALATNPPASREFTDAPVAGETGTPPVTPSAPAARAETPASEPSAVPALRAEGPAIEPKAAAAPGEGGRLLVRSTPPGAEVLVNGVSKGVTPLTLRDLPLGTHTVVLTRPGYARTEQRVALTRARPSRSVEARLVSDRATKAPASTPASRPAPRATTGALVVESRPAGAVVTIDGNEAGSTPLTLETIAPGRHTVRLTRPGYPPWTTTVTVESGGRARVAASLGREDHD